MDFVACIKQIVEEFGTERVAQRSFIGLLEDYQAFEDVAPSFKLVLKHWSENGKLDKISGMSANDSQWQIDVSNIIHQTESEGFQKEVASDLLHKLLLGIGIVDSSFDWNEEFNHQEKSLKKTISNDEVSNSKTNPTTQPENKKGGFFTRLFGSNNNNASISAEECYQNAISAKSNGNSSDYIEWLKKAAQKGSLEAYLALGQYYNGNNAAQDYAEAIKWFYKGANKGSDACAVNLGFMYAYGHGTDVDHNKAMSYFEVPAKAGNHRAQFGMGYCNYHRMVQLQNKYKAITEGSLRCYNEAKRWLSYLAEKGDANAQYYLGVVYNYTEFSSESDRALIEKSYEWLDKARKQGHKAANDYINRFGIYYWRGY